MEDNTKTSPSPWLQGLTPAQTEAVTHGDTPLLIVAGAGTGKTRTLACRVAHLLSRGIAPERILLLTFTRRAAGELVQRATRMASSEATGRVWGGTFHAIANRLLRIHGRAVDLPPDFTVMDATDAADLMGLLRTELGFAKKDRRFPSKGTLVKIYSHTVNAQSPLGEVVRKHFPWCADDIDTIKEVFTQYVERKKTQSVLDYDDLLLFWSALCESPDAGAAVAERFDHVLVDEYQDTNAVQAEILHLMRRNNPRITVVGDDAQSIYSFRAATIRNILDFPDQFPDTHVVTLQQNYRSTQPILSAANAVMAKAKERYTKELFSDRASDQKPVLTICVDETQQCEAVCGQILEHLEQGIPLMHQSVLFRASHHSAQLEIELARRNIPFHKFGGLKFLEAAHIKDMLALLRVLENPYDEISWYRILMLFDGIGPRTAQRVMTELGVRDGRPRPRANDLASAPPMGHPLRRLFSGPPNIPPAARETFAELRFALAQCSGVTIQYNGKARRGKKTKDASDDVAHARRPGLPDDSPTAVPLPAQIDRIRAFYEPIFKRTYENAAVRLRDLEQLGLIASRYRSRSRFITDLTLDPPSATSDLAQAPHLDEDYLILSTIHSAKGCEWTAVYIIHAADGMIPSDMAISDDAGIDEERRLFYVAMTRAKDWLYVYYPLRYYHRRYSLGDFHGYAQPTRFIDDTVRKHFEERAAYSPTDSDDAAGTAHGQNPYDRVSKLWEDE